MKERYMTFGDRLTYTRKKKGLLQRQLAELIGVSSVTVSHWEKGYDQPKAFTMRKLTTALKVSEDWFENDDNFSIKKAPDNQGSSKLNDRKLSKAEQKFVANNAHIIDYALGKQLHVKDFDELYGVAALAICKAVKHYDKNRGTFYPVAFAFIKWAVYNFYREEYNHSIHPLSLDQMIGASDVDDDVDDELGSHIQAPDEFEPLEYKILVESVYQKVEPVLTDKEKEVFRPWLHGEDDSVIAKQLGISQHAVVTRRFTANQKCRTFFNPEEIFA